MATFVIRRNHPYGGVVTLCKIASGSFVAREMTVTESAFVAAVMRYLEKISPAEQAKLRRSAPLEEIPPVTAGQRRSFKVNKAAAT